MRKLRRARFGFAVLFSTALGAWVAACSGSDSQDVVAAPDTGPEASLPETSTPDVVNDVVLDVVKDTGPVYDAGPANVLEAGAEYEGGIPCVVGGVLEEEPNDDKASANTLMPTRCGAVLLTADGGTAESDFLTFQLKATTTNFFIQFSGDISMKIEVEGHPAVTITPTMSAPVPLVKDKPYFIEVRSLSPTKRANWRVTVFES